MVNRITLLTASALYYGLLLTLPSTAASLQLRTIPNKVRSSFRWIGLKPKKANKITTSPPTSPTEQQVKDLFQLWNNALIAEDADAVAKRYAKQAVLLPTVSDVPRTNYGLIKDYFTHFLASKPSGEILESYVTIGNNWCSDMGIYEFTMGTTGEKVKGRYTFVYVWEDGQWMINHHHSSKMPESAAKKSTFKEEKELAV